MRFLLRTAKRKREKQEQRRARAAKEGWGKKMLGGQEALKRDYAVNGTL